MYKSKDLYLQNQNLKKININLLKEYITKLYCWNNDLKIIPKLPKNIKILDCSSNNNLKKIYNINYLEQLFCYENKRLKKLPKFSSKIHYLSIGWCNIKKLPFIPEQLDTIHFLGNKIHYKIKTNRKFNINIDNLYLILIGDFKISKNQLIFIN